MNLTNTLYLTFEDFKNKRDAFYLWKGRKEQIEKDIKSYKNKKIELEDRLIHVEKARAVVQHIAKNTQQELEFHVSNVVNLALSSVFSDPYEFIVKFVDRRGKTECDLLFKKKDEEFNPMTTVGGGALDIAAFALRCVFWSFNESRSVIILDEPFRFVSVDLQEKCSYMLKELSKKLGLQIIMISHLPNIINSADRIFEVTQEGGIGNVKMVE